MGDIAGRVGALRPRAPGALAIALALAPKMARNAPRAPGEKPSESVVLPWYHPLAARERIRGWWAGSLTISEQTVIRRVDSHAT